MIKSKEEMKSRGIEIDLTIGCDEDVLVVLLNTKPICNDCILDVEHGWKKPEDLGLKTTITKITPTREKV
jgi:hypothetical protein